MPKKTDRPRRPNGLAESSDAQSGPQQVRDGCGAQTRRTSPSDSRRRDFSMNAAKVQQAKAGPDVQCALRTPAAQPGPKFRPACGWSLSEATAAARQGAGGAPRQPVRRSPVRPARFEPRSSWPLPGRRRRRRQKVQGSAGAARPLLVVFRRPRAGLIWSALAAPCIIGALVNYTLAGDGQRDAERGVEVLP